MSCERNSNSCRKCKYSFPFNGNDFSCVYCSKHLSDWTSNVVDFGYDSANKEMRVVLEHPLPSGYIPEPFLKNNLLCVQNSGVGGIWEVFRVLEDRKRIVCSVPKDNYDWEVVVEDSNSVQIVEKSKDRSKPVSAFFLKPIVFHCRSSVYAVNNIDTVNQTFYADVYTELRLKCISSSGSKEDVMEFVQHLDILSKIDFLGISDEDSREIYFSFTPSEEKENSKEKEKQGKFDYCIKIRLKATFSQGMELQMFPFDSQDLNISPTVNCPNGCVILQGNRKFPSLLQLHGFTLGSTFNLPLKSNLLQQDGWSDPSESASKYIYPRVSFTLVIERRPWYYINNLMAPMFLISLLATISFAIKEDGELLTLTDRISLLLTLLLTAVAFKFVVNSSLPLLSYNSQLDIFVWICFSYLFALIAECAIFTAVVVGLERTDYFDSEVYVGIALLGIYILSNAIWIVHAVAYSRTKHENTLVR